jgi:hypothetical protein
LDTKLALKLPHQTVEDSLPTKLPPPPPQNAPCLLPCHRHCRRQDEPFNNQDWLCSPPHYKKLASNIKYSEMRKMEHPV